MFDAGWCLYFDTLNLVMLVVFTSVSSLVHPLTVLRNLA